MAALQEFRGIRQRLKTSKKAHVDALYKFIFEDIGSRSNRQQLREFTGFDYDERDVRYNTKLAYITENLTKGDLMLVCIMLGLDHNAEDLYARIFKNLSRNTLLVDAAGDDDEGEEAENVQFDAEEENERETDSVIDARSVSVRSSHRTDNRYQDMGPGHVGPRFNLNFRDVEDSIRAFDGSGTVPVEAWIQEFIEVAALMGWDQLQMMIFAKRSLKGLAKLFVAGERGLTSWPKLRDALLSEFGRKINSAQLHKMLCERKMRSNEGLQEYFYVMKDIAAQGEIEESALVQYVIEGIKDLHTNKAILYGASTIKEFKVKLTTYEMFTKKQKSQTEGFTAGRNRNDERSVERKSVMPSRQDVKVTCYKCGGKGHVAANCARGTKCFKCNKFGHISRECKNKVSDDKPNNVQTIAYDKPTRVAANALMYKGVSVLDKECTALFDTGSVVNLISSRLHADLGEPQMSSSSVSLKGFGHKGKGLQPLGKVRLDVDIDDDTFSLEFHVVTNDCMNAEMVIGQPVCDQAEVSINSDGVHIRKMDEIAMMQFYNEVEDDTIDIGEAANTNYKEAIGNIIRDYKPNKKKSTGVQMKITLLDEAPIAVGPRRLPLVEKQIVDEQIEQWLENGIVENSDSEFSSPIVLVGKKDGGKRLCVDYRKINKVIVKDRFPLPLIEDQLDRLKDASWFSTIDLKNGFHHVPVDVGSRKYTAFVTHSGQFQFCRVPFGLSNSPAVFQRHINAIFRDMTRRGVALPYVDDIIIPAKTEVEAVQNVKEVLKQCEDYGLSINWKKCHFLKREIEFLGHVIKDRTISPSTAKKDVMVKYPLPRTTKQVESFLGLAGYFRKFIPDFANIAKPLSDLKKKDAKFNMGEAQICSFNALKEKLSRSPVLKIFHEKHETELHTDASADGYGAALMQNCPEDGKMHPVYYMSKKTTDLEKKYTSYELEILAVVEALKKFRVYLLGIHFKIITDCNAFATTMNKKELPTRVSRWLMLLQEYNYTVEHRSGTRMRHVDALSRYAVMTIEAEDVITRVARAQKTDEDLQPIFEILSRIDEYRGFFLKSNVLYKLVNDQELMVVPKLMECEVIKRAHERGHFSVQKTKNLLSSDYYLTQLEEKIRKCVNNCIECVLMNKKRGMQEGEQHPIPKEGTPLHTYHIDHLGPLESTSKLYKHIFVVIDGFTKFCWLYPTKSTTSKEVIARLQLQSGTFGNPKVIISDRGTAFTSDEFKKYCADEGIKHHQITTGVPRANGQAERLNSVIISVLSKLSIEDATKWYKHVTRVQKIINSSQHRSTNATPFEMLIGCKMRDKEDLQIKQIVEDEMRIQYDELREQLRADARSQIAKVQNENRNRYNLRRKPAKKYKVGDHVAIKRTQFGGGLKLRAKYLGPYAVTVVKPNDTYNVTKVGSCEGTIKTTTCAEFMKMWPGEDPGPSGSKV